MQSKFILAIEKHQANQINDAEKLYSEAINEGDNIPDCMHLLGLIHHRKGESYKAIEFIQNAIAMRGAHEYENSLAVVLFEIGQTYEANVILTRLIELHPDYAEAHNNLGNVYRRLWKFDRAIGEYRAAIDINPDYVDARSNLGLVLSKFGDSQGAYREYQLALALDAYHQQSIIGIGKLLLQNGRYEEAIEIATRYPHWQSDRLIKTFLGKCIVESRNLLISKSKIAQNLLPIAILEGWARPSKLISVAMEWLVHDIADILDDEKNEADDWDNAKNILNKLAGNRIALSALVAAPLTNRKIEKLLTRLRFALLDHFGQNNRDLECESSAECASLLSALAIQCFLNEYVYPLSQVEKELICRLKSKIPMSPKFNDQSKIYALVLACYEPLSEDSVEILESFADTNDAVNLVIEIQYREPRTELLMESSIAKVTEINSTISLLVKNQYEENPYPRWRIPVLAVDPLPPLARVQELCPTARIALECSTRNSAQILIAGCGSGQQAIEASRSYANSEILAMDLSLKSLCYAKRVAQDLNIQNIVYVNGDILEVGCLGRGFDVIECCGVLHHMENPDDGLRELMKVLPPGGLIKLGLYSAHARRYISQARSWFTKTENSVAGIRQARELILNTKNAVSDAVISIADFYSTSSCRDLLFHVQEHTYTIPEISTLLQRNGLAFLGFEIDEKITIDYVNQYPDDRGRNNLIFWDQYEKDHPDTFLSMYQFWAQKCC